MTRRTKLGLLALLAMLALATFASPAGAQTEDEKKQLAREFYDKGITHYNLGEFDAAIGEFRKAYAISQAPGLLFNIAQSFRLKKDYEQAAYFYKTYLRLKQDAPNKLDVEARIIEMEKLLEEQKALGQQPPRGTIPPDGDAATGGGTVTTTTTTTVIPPADKPTETVVVDPNTTVTVNERPAADGVKPEGPGQGEPLRRPGAALKIAGYATAGAGGALLLTGVVFGLMASSAASDLTALNDAGGTWTQEQQDQYDAGKRNNTIAVISYIAGGAAVATGGALWFLGYRQDKAAAKVAVSPTPGGASVAVGWSF